MVERCRYVTGGMEVDLTPLPGTTDVSFVYNTPIPFCDTPLLVLVKLSNELCQIKTIELSLVRLAVVRCTSADGV